MNISYIQSNLVLNTAIGKAKKINSPVSIAVVDTGGHLAAFARLDSVYGVVDFSIKKAKTVVMFGADSDVMETIIAGAELNSCGMINSNDGLLTIAGGFVIKNKDGIAMGAIGSYGGKTDQDKEIASFGTSVIL